MEFKDYLQAIGIFIMFFVVLYGAYFVSRMLGKSQQKRSNGQNMTIIEILPVGQQKTLQLIRVGSEHLLIGVTRDRITFVQKIDDDGLIMNESNNSIVPFSSFMNKLIHNEDKIKDGDGLGEELDGIKKK